MLLLLLYVRQYDDFRSTLWRLVHDDDSLLINIESLSPKLLFIKAYQRLHPNLAIFLERLDLRVSGLFRGNTELFLCVLIFFF